MNWKRVFFTCIIFLSFNLVVYGQENRINFSPVNYDRFDTVNFKNDKFIAFEMEMPSLTYLRPAPAPSFKLLEIDFNVDLRKQALQNKTPFLYESKNPHVIEKFSVRLPANVQNKTTINGRNRLDFSVNRGSVRNSVYRDASFYTGAYNPFTGLPY